MALAGGILAPPAIAQDLSPGCQAIDDPIYDGRTGFGSLTTLFATGEVISVSASESTFPHDLFYLSVKSEDGTIDFYVEAGLGQKIDYVIQVTGTYRAEWSTVFGGTITFMVSCEAPAAPAPDLEVADLKGLVAGLGLPSGLATALQSKLDEALAALDAGDTAGACGSLQAFLNQVGAQAGKMLTAAEAEQLSDAANAIRDLLDC